MNLLDIVREVRRHLEESGRLSVRMLRRQYELDDDALEEVIEELVDVQRIARREENVLEWVQAAAPATTESRELENRNPPAGDRRLPYTPKHLADKILQSKSALEGERKQVTVLFADVKGSMDLAEQLGAERWHGILDRFFSVLADGVHRFEGTVNQYTGDGVMALFGAPIAHEDHAQRACFAALHLRDALGDYADELRRTQGVSFSTRIGINSGEVVVGKIGDDLRMDYTAQGHTVGLAQRMEQTAAADSTFLTAHTARLVEGYFQLRDLGEFDLKGALDPLRVYELQGVGSLRTRLDSSRSRGFSKFVGRDPEMTSLDAALEATIAGNGQVIGVMAEAGTGKSRLCLEFVERCRARGIRVNEAHCPSHGKTVAYLPLLEMLRDIFGIEARDNDHEARRKIAGELMLLDETFQSLLPILFDFMGVADRDKPAAAMSPDERQQRLFAFLRHLIQTRSEREPTVLFVDDLHWIDPGSDAFLAHSIETAAQTRTLWLVNFRPEYQADWMRKSFYQQLPLRPLGAEAIEALLADLLGNDASVAALPARIHERTSGNPFFIEEIVQSLCESGKLEGTKGNLRLVAPDDALELPATVHNVLAARLDRLPEQEKRVLQTASVIGKEFPGALLESIVALSDRNVSGEANLTDTLRSLARSEFIFETALYPEVEYAFKHPLTQEVAYTSQLVTRRAELHADVARGIEQMHADKLEERAALLAYHWEQTDETLTAAQWHARAADVAGLDSPADALRHWEKVRTLLAPLPPSDESAMLRLQATSQLLVFGFRQGMSNERVDEILLEGKALAVARDDVRTQVRLLYGAALHYMNRGAIRRTLEYNEESRALAVTSGDPESLWVSGEILEYNLMQVGELEAALRVNDDQIELSRSDPNLGIEIIGISTANSFSHRGNILTDLGRFSEAEDAFQRAEEMMARSNETELLSWTAMGKSLMFDLIGNTQAAVTASRLSIEIAEKVGSILARVLAHASLGQALASSGQWQAAGDSLELSLELGRAHRVGLFRKSNWLSSLAEARLGLGDTARARELVDDAVETASRMEISAAEIQAHIARARILSSLDGMAAHDEIDATLERALALVRSTGARAYEPQIYVERAQLAATRSDPTLRAHWLHEAHRLFTELGATGHAERIAPLLMEAPT